jgi:hypothetical protein
LYIPVIKCHTPRCRMPAHTASQFLIYHPETIHIVELLVWHQAPADISEFKAHMHPVYMHEGEWNSMTTPIA